MLDLHLNYVQGDSSWWTAMKRTLNDLLLLLCFCLQHPSVPSHHRWQSRLAAATSSVHCIGTKGHLNNTSGASWASSPLAAESISSFGEMYGVKWVGKGKRKQTLAFVWPWKQCVVCALTWSCWFGDFKQDCARFHVPDFEPGEVYLVNIFLWSAQIICRGKEI